MGITLFPVGAGGSGGGETDLNRLDARTREIESAVRDLASVGTGHLEAKLVLKN